MYRPPDLFGFLRWYPEISSFQPSVQKIAHNISMFIPRNSR